MPDMNEFLELAHRAGIGTLNSLAIAEALEISTSYVQKLRSGSELVRPPIRAKLDALIAAKANGPVDQAIIDEADDSVEPSREQVEVDLQAGPILTPTNEQSSWSEPADLPPARDYAVIDATDGTAVLVEILARFNNHTAARKICQKLNKEGG